ncbi:hypothetical protein [Asticcacaulis solisilvae]|uniref:hypothetical protein n=1 Tax=Asticcacaulis solisilvae TaxID=1217274 RepID=UPI003FD89478
MTANEIRLFSKVRINGKAGETPVRLVEILNVEIATMGFTLSGDLMAALTGLDTDAFQAERKRLLNVLAKLSGKTVDYTRLFSGFPYDVPDQHDYFVNRIVGAIKSVLGVRSKAFTTLSCGHVIDLQQFDLDAFGACPICQFSVAELRSPSGQHYNYRQLTPLKPLGYLSPADAVAKGEALLARPSSLSADEKAWLLEMIGEGAALRVPASCFRETVPFVYLLGGVEAVRPHLNSATDILRIAALVSAPDADLSLKTSVKFKLSTAHTARLLGMLETVGNLQEDLLRHRERWLRLAEQFHVGAARNRGRFPNAAAAFDALRNAPKTIATFNRTVERGLRAKAFSPEVLTTLSRRPGELMRRLDQLLRSAPEPDTVLAAARRVLPDIPTPRLFELYKYFGARDQQALRVFLPKGNENRMQVERDRRPAIDRRVIDAARAMLQAELTERLRALPPLGATYIDPRLKDHLVPFNRRGDSTTLSPVTKGSRYPFAGDVIRLFVYWVGHVDVDLSILMYDESLSEKGHVAFTNTQFPGCVHSGDIQDAPEGASEFVDFDITSLVAQDIRYVAATVHSFRGQKFAQFPCFAGFMQRDALRSGSVYEPQSVALKFDLTAPNTTHMPLVFDLIERKVIFSDISAGNRSHGAVIGEVDKHRTLLQSVLSLGERKPTLYDVVLAHAQARGKVVECPSGADHVYGVADIEGVVRDFVDGPVI